MMRDRLAKCRTRLTRGAQEVADIASSPTGLTPILEDQLLLMVWTGGCLMILGGQAGRVFLATVIGLWAYPVGLAIAVPMSFVVMCVATVRLSSMGLLIFAGAATLAAVLSPWIPILVYTGRPLSP